MNGATNAGNSGWDKNGVVAFSPIGGRAVLSGLEQTQIAIGKHLWVPGRAPDRDAVTVGSCVLDAVAVLGVSG